MTGICAFSSTDSKLAKSNVETMLQLLEARGTTPSVRECEIAGLSFGIGYCNERDALSGTLREASSSIQAIDGSFFPCLPDSDMHHSLVNDPDVLFRSPGAFAILGS